MLGSGVWIEDYCVSRSNHTDRVVDYRSSRVRTGRNRSNHAKRCLFNKSDTVISGKGLRGISVTAQGGNDDIGRIVRCRITGLKNNTLTAERI